jgi:hypothetical protein
MRLILTFPIILACAGSRFAAPAHAADFALTDGSFESSGHDSWSFRHGGEGSGASRAQIATPPIAAHQGRLAARLETESSGDAKSHAWSSASQTVACTPGSKVKISAWLLDGSDVTATNATAQIRIEYFEDDQAKFQVCHHMRMTSDISPAKLSTNAWTELDLSDTVPAAARSAIISFVLCARGPAGALHRLWFDDVALAVTPPAPAQQH